MEQVDSKEVKEFVDAQAAVTSAVLSSCDHRGRLRGQLTALFDHPRFRAPFKRRGTIRVMRVRDKEHLPDTLSWVSCSSIEAGR
jgi:prolyl oligopeptidase PreP (S9A serine peptidase family)